MSRAVRQRKEEKKNKKKNMSNQHLKPSYGFTSLIFRQPSDPELEKNMGFGQVWRRWRDVVGRGMEMMGGNQIAGGWVDLEREKVKKGFWTMKKKNHIHFFVARNHKQNKNECLKRSFFLPFNYIFNSHFVSISFKGIAAVVIVRVFFLSIS